jgi:hypothetical protein
MASRLTSGGRDRHVGRPFRAAGAPEGAPYMTLSGLYVVGTYPKITTDEAGMMMMTSRSSREATWLPRTVIVAR